MIASSILQMMKLTAQQLAQGWDTMLQSGRAGLQTPVSPSLKHCTN